MGQPRARAMCSVHTLTPSNFVATSAPNEECVPSPLIILFVLHLEYRPILFYFCTLCGMSPISLIFVVNFFLFYGPSILGAVTRIHNLCYRRHIGVGAYPYKYTVQE